MEFGQAAPLLFVRKFDNQDAVLRDQPNQRDESDLRINVQCGGPAIGEKAQALTRHLEKAEDQRAEDGERHRAKQNDQRIAEAVELRREHEKDQHQRQRERRQEFIALGAQLAGFTGVLQLVAFRQDLGGFGFQIPQRLIERADGHAADFHGVELLEAVERARAVFLFQRGKGGKKYPIFDGFCQFSMDYAGTIRGIVGIIIIYKNTYEKNTSFFNDCRINSECAEGKNEF